MAYLDGGDGRGRGPGLVFVAEGPFVVAEDDGSWELSGLAPGAATVRAWHTRFPALTREATVVAGQRVEADLDLSVSAISGSSAAPR